MKTREQWLSEAVEVMGVWFEDFDYIVPPVRVTCGWPSRGGCATKKRTIGQCWDTEPASDGVNQIFISPFLSGDGKEEGLETDVLSTLVHELVHAVVGVPEGHKKAFRRCATAVGLEGKMTSTHAGEVLLGKIKGWHETLGNYPHAKLDPTGNPVKTQTTRMIKCECKCGYVVRISRKWLGEVGNPHCPKDGEMQPEIKE